MSIDLKTAPQVAKIGAAQIVVPQSAPGPAIKRPRSVFALGFDRLTISLAVLGVILLLGALAPVLAPHDPNKVDMLARMAPPVWLDGGTWNHILGTDQIGRDLLSRAMWGIVTSFGIATFGLIFSAVLGIGLGVVSGRWWLV